MKITLQHLINFNQFRMWCHAKCKIISVSLSVHHPILSNSNHTNEKNIRERPRRSVRARRILSLRGANELRNESRKSWSKLERRAIRPRRSRRSERERGPGERLYSPERAGARRTDVSYQHTRTLGSIPYRPPDS